jgi:RNA polymerase sigma factor (sigma-70 family)
MLVDAAMKDRAVQWVRAARCDKDQLRILLLASPARHDQILECVSAGAHGCVSENCSLQCVQDAVRRASAGETICSPEIVRSIFSGFQSLERESRSRRLDEANTLTPREQEVLQLIAGHLTNKQIARRLSVSLYTVKNHVHSILEKLRVDSRQQAAVQAKRWQWLDRFPPLRSEGDDETVFSSRPK